MLVCAFLSNGGLNHIASLCLFHFLEVDSGGCCYDEVNFGVYE